MVTFAILTCVYTYMYSVPLCLFLYTGAYFVSNTFIFLINNSHRCQSLALKANKDTVTFWGKCNGHTCIKAFYSITPGSFMLYTHAQHNHLDAMKMSEHWNNF